MTKTTSNWRWRLFQLLAIAFFLVPASAAFTLKFFDLIVIAGMGEEGAFALYPIMTYLLSSLGFVMLFLWAVRHGMFREIEKVKYTMLETEQKLDMMEEWEKETHAWR
jgi:hypothetical protein